MNAFFLPGMLAAILNQAPVEPLSLKACESLSLKNSTAVKIAEANFRKSKAQVEQARAGLLPQVGTQGQHTRFDSSNPQSGRNDSTTFGAAVTWNADLTGLVSLAVRAADAGLKAAEATTQAERNEVILNTRVAYFNVQRALWGEQIQVQAVENAERRLENGKRKLAVGSSSKFDVLRLETALAAAKSESIIASTQVSISKKTLNFVLTRPVDMPVEIEALPLPEPQSYDGKALTVWAYKTRPDILALEYTKLTTEAIRRSEEKGLSPNLSLSLNYLRTLNPGPFSRSNQWNATATLSWPLFDGGITRARTKQAREEELKVQLALEQAKLAVSFEIQQLLDRFRAAQARRDLAVKALDEAREALRLSEVLLDSGKGILLDVTTSQESLTRAQLALSQADYDILETTAQLMRAVGSDDLTPTPEEVNR